MDRLACLDLPAFPLQCLARAKPDWHGEPAAAVDRDAPHGTLLSVNERAFASGVRTGMRYAAALGLCPRLRAGVVTKDEIARCVSELVESLQHFSPHVQPGGVQPSGVQRGGVQPGGVESGDIAHGDGEPGVFWLDARGLERLFGAPRAWAEAIHAGVARKGYEGRIVVGMRRFTTYAAAKALGRSPVAVFDDLAHELRVASGVSLARLLLDPDARDALTRLGVANVGDFAKLPAGGILQRFGPAVHRLHRMAAGALDEALEPARETIPFSARADLEFPEISIEGVLAHVEQLAGPLCAALARSGEVAVAIDLRLDLDDRARVEEQVRPAKPTCDLGWLLRLLRMRLASRALSAGAVRIEVVLERAPAATEQATLFACAKRRPPAAAGKALSVLRAMFGDEVVVCAKPASAHLPERSFTFERCEALEAAEPRAASAPALVRRLYETPQKLPPRGRHEPDGWLLRGVTHGSVVKLHGPHRLSGGWWGVEVQREYYFAELTGGEIAWVYYDVPRRRWFLHGSVS